MHPMTVATCFYSTFFFAETLHYSWSYDDEETLPFGKALLVACLETLIVIAWNTLIGHAPFFTGLGFRSYKTTTTIWCMKKDRSGLAMIHEAK